MADSCLSQPRRPRLPPLRLHLRRPRSKNRSIPAGFIMPPHLDPAIVREAAARALGEDRGPADITTLVCVSPEAQTSARILVKEPCILAGLPVAEQVFREQDAFLFLTPRARDGDSLKPG